MQLRESLLLVRGQPLITSRDVRAVFDGGGVGRDDGGDDVVDGSADAQAVERDDIADDEGCVGVVDEVVLVGGEVLMRC